MDTFWLGTHEPSWLARLDVPVPLFVSHRRLARRRSMPQARTAWALDSGGFSELSLFGGWQTSPVTYTTAVRRYQEEIGKLAWAAPQDWMCEPDMIARTGLSVAEHQRRTVANLIELRALAPDLPWIPVVQGYTVAEYLACVDAYTDAGVDLATEPLVGLGSVCRRQATGEAHHIILALHGVGVTRLHGFGVKVLGLRRYGHLLTSSDSLAWSYQARRRDPLPGCQHRACSNCPRWALAWRERVLATSVPAHHLPDTTAASAGGANQGGTHARRRPAPTADAPAEDTRGISCAGDASRRGVCRTTPRSSPRCCGLPRHRRSHT